MTRTLVKTEVAILGAGIIGAACAFELARLGCRVALLDARAPTSGSSGACDGYVSVSTKTPGLAMSLALESKRVYPEVVAALGIDVEYEAHGGMLVIEESADLPAIEAHVAALRASGVEVEMLGRQAAREAEPGLAPTIAGAASCAIEAHVSPYRMNLALVEGARRHGASAWWNTAPLGVERAGDRIVAIETAELKVVAEQYVFCAGVWSKALGMMAGVNLPVVPRRGILVVTERSAPVARRFLVSARYLTAKADPDAAARSSDPLVKLGYGFVLDRTRSGQHIVGSTRTFSGFDRSAPLRDVALILREGAARVPGLDGLSVLRGFAGLRPFVPDKKPLLGRSRIVANLLVATGHEGDGITMAPITGRIIAALANGRDPPLDIGAMDPDRFGLPANADASLQA
ncbi:MAG: FAD-binding oxidoreductase [Alphaproteobacteria bacterium]|nr:FAD-binding oxidoreductase [Alphaproteobacteria bacterium]